MSDSDSEPDSLPTGTPFLNPKNVFQQNRVTKRNTPSPIRNSPRKRRVTIINEEDEELRIQSPRFEFTRVREKQVRFVIENEQDNSVNRVFELPHSEEEPQHSEGEPQHTNEEPNRGDLDQVVENGAVESITDQGSELGTHLESGNVDQKQDEESHVDEESQMGHTDEESQKENGEHTDEVQKDVPEVPEEAEEAAMHSDIPTDLPSDAPTDLPSEVPSEVPVDTPADTPADTPGGVPPNEPVGASEKVSLFDFMQTCCKKTLALPPLPPASPNFISRTIRSELELIRSKMQVRLNQCYKTIELAKFAEYPITLLEKIRPKVNNDLEFSSLAAKRISSEYMIEYLKNFNAEIKFRNAEMQSISKHVDELANEINANEQMVSQLSAKLHSEGFSLTEFKKMAIKIDKLRTEINEESEFLNARALNEQMVNKKFAESLQKLHKTDIVPTNFLESNKAFEYFVDFGHEFNVKIRFYATYGVVCDKYMTLYYDTERNEFKHEFSWPPNHFVLKHYEPIVKRQPTIKRKIRLWKRALGIQKLIQKIKLYGIQYPVQQEGQLVFIQMYVDLVARITLSGTGVNIESMFDSPLLKQLEDFSSMKWSE